MADNPLLTHLLFTVQNGMEELRRKYGTMPRDVLENFNKEHLEICHMVKNRDPEGARDAMVRHIEDAWTDSLYAGLKKE